jgi:hypothetical protein
MGGLGTYQPPASQSVLRRSVQRGFPSEDIPRPSYSDGTLEVGMDPRRIRVGLLDGGEWRSEPRSCFAAPTSMLRNSLVLAGGRGVTRMHQRWAMINGSRVLQMYHRWGGPPENG